MSFPSPLQLDADLRGLPPKALRLVAGDPTGEFEYQLCHGQRYDISIWS
jgi:hypothetical protein